MKLHFILLLTLLVPALALSQGIRGTIQTTKGEPLPYAAVIARGTSTGTMANAEGRFELALKPGTYQIIFQYLGFKTIQREVAVGSGFTEINVSLEEQAFNLNEVKVGSNQEDAAYSIMRRAIAKAKIHQLQVLSYKARAYSKVSVTITDLPMEFLYKKQLKEAEKEANFKKGVPMLNETVSEVTFQQPNTYRQRVIATRNSVGEDMSVNQYFLTSFYRPEVAKTVSPLSPKAFAYYKFEYEGTYREQGVDINKIKVIPRSYGEGVFRGVIYIIEGTWAIHSLQLETIGFEGLTVNIRHLYSPVQGVWMPVNQRFDVRGKIFGVGGNGQFIINQTFNELKVNPAFVEEIQVIDEKKEKPATQLSNRDIKGQKLEDMVAKQKEYSTKNLKQLIKEYEKQERKERKENKEPVAVTRNDSTIVDSLAVRRNVAFWDSLRTIPLTSAESKSYVRSDSIKITREVKVQKDSTKKATNSRTFQPAQLITGNTWSLNKRTTLTWDDLVSSLGYNTVEGYTVEGGLKLTHYLNQKKTDEISLHPIARYQFGRQQFVGYATAQYRHNRTNLRLSGGRYVYQFNPNSPISPALNTLTTLLFEQNFMKLYQKDYFATLSLDARPFSGRINFSGSLDYAQRSELANYRENLKPWINWNQYTFTPNRPDNAEIGPAAFPTHQALVLNLVATGRLKAATYRISNGRRVTRRNDSPLLLLNYRKGVSGVGGSDVDFDFLQAGISHSFETGIRSRLSYDVRVGGFLNNRSLYFPDFRHFQGNQFFFQQGDPTAIYRMLPYYDYSTGKRFVDAHVLSEFRKFLLTQITYVRLTGLKENLFVHYLGTPASRNYTEVGYGLDGILRLFRVEVVTQWQDFKYQRLGFRVGTTLTFGR
ncbi:DUF5686 and carboxypeptidase regulatory-like domain-containing protein [Nibrella saemangeumensis]|uniref:DUF5686 and carboxypeptidase regulatory-like domain-containing protein n=1 Tax=Nibrella saemangeumensis TaxID=1084526 RepID=A0ABP8M944_9BACT